MTIVGYCIFIEITVWCSWLELDDFKNELAERLEGVLFVFRT